MNPHDQLRICYFPGREASYTRTRVIREALSQANISFWDCSYPHRKWQRYFFSFLKFLKYLRRSDIILIGFCGHHLVPIVRLLTQKPIIFDAYISVYETLALERQRCSPNGPIAHLARGLDRWACLLSQHVILDTNAHIAYFQKEFRLNANNFTPIAACPVTEPLPPLSAVPKDVPLVHFHGEFQSLHGVECIIEAAALVPEAKFRLIGAGRELHRCQALVRAGGHKNVEFIPSLPYPDLLKRIQEADICLGIFGGTPKAQMVIPNKVYECLSLGKSVITQDSPAIREYFEDQKDLLLCPARSPEILAQQIRRLLKDEPLRRALGTQGQKTFFQKGSLRKVSIALKSLIESFRLPLTA